MKTTAFFWAILAMMLSACEKPDEEEQVIPEIVGSFGYVELLIDPGDGSGTFQPVQSLKTITFNIDGTVTSNGELCLFTFEAIEGSTGIYSDDTKTITTGFCAPLNYELDHNELIIKYGCIEPCQAKYLRIAN